MLAAGTQNTKNFAPSAKFSPVFVYTFSLWAPNNNNKS